VTTRRFQPSRAGIINLWDYRDEEFIFVNGWLVLRGPNGSGKTKALEVLFPFVLDGRIEPRRLNPFASEERTMKSNLLYRGQELSHAYTWMEFRRPGPDGDAGSGTQPSDADEFVTIGIGLRAHRHADKVTRWHFVVDGRVGVDFSLIDDDDRPVNRRDLAAQIGADHVIDQVGDYRRAVDARLFGLGPARYEQLLDLVLTLRKPQLAKDLNPAELSRTLQRGLRPIDDNLVAEAANAFDDMESVAKTLDGLIAADNATSAFLSVYSTYLRTHARAAADAVTQRRDTVDQRGRELVDATSAEAAATRTHDAAAEQAQQAQAEPGRLRARLASLQDSAAYRSHQQLEDLRRHVQDLRAAAERADATVTRHRASVERLAVELDAARRTSHDADTAVRQLVTDVSTHAESAGIDWSGAKIDPIAPGVPDGWAQQTAASTIARRDDIHAVRAGLRQVDQAETDRSRADRDTITARQAVDVAEAHHRAADADVAGARVDLVAAVDAWHQAHLDQLTGLADTPLPAALAAAVHRIGEPDTPSLREVVVAGTTANTTRIREDVIRLESDRDASTHRRSALGAERDRIAAEQDDAPPPQPARLADRAGRPGAPLWQLVDFAPTVPEEARAGIEAALQVAGLLDAWIHPQPAQTHRAVQRREQDGYLVARPGARPTGDTLATVLVPEPAAGVATAVVADVLSCIAVRKTMPVGSAAEHPVVTRAGQFAHGIVVGAHTKPAAEYIGATARAWRRAARVAECDRLIAELDEHLTGIDTSLAAYHDLLTGLDGALTRLPSTGAVTAALRSLDRAAVTLRLRREAEVEAAAALDQAVALVAAAALALRRTCAQRSLPASAVDAVDEAVRRFEQVCLTVPPAINLATASRSAAAAATQRHGQAEDASVQAQQEARDAHQRHSEKSEAYTTLSSAVADQDVARTVREVAETERAIEVSEQHHRELSQRHLEAFGALTAAQQRVASTNAAIALAVQEAEAVSLRLRPFAHADLLSLLRCPTQLRWATRSGDDAIRAQDRGELPPEVIALHDAILAVTKDLTPTENSLKQSATRLTSALNELQVQLPAAGLDHRPEFDTDEGLIVVRIADEQGLTPVAGFGERIVRERQDQENLLTEAERRVFEDALLTQIARQIHHRTIEARDLVDGMDDQMRSRRMSSGMTVGVGWHLADDLDPEQREICRILDRDPARLSPAQLATMRRHFADRIKAARAMQSDQPYRELLAQVVDYRQWRVFAFTLHRPHAPAEPLTRARHSQLSGGEQSVSLHLPLFAAANALFSSAPGAPRILGLDEAFAGVDETGRGELMSLAVQFDLDLFMTGFDLWATQASVPGAAHYDLSHSSAEHAVAAVLIAWNGTVAVADFDATLARTLGSPETRRRLDRPPATATPR
jgi:uncharacterized protein (TIGR02680 family)